MRRGLLSTLVLLLGVTLTAASVSLTPRSWKSFGSEKIAFSTASDGGLSIALPTWPEYVGYAWTASPGPLAGALVLELRVETTGAPTFRWDTEPGNTCVGVPAQVRAFIGRYSQGGRKAIAFADRWWTKASYVLALGSTTLTIPLESDQFVGLHFTGLSDQQAFDLALADPDILGVSFGGGCFFAHGVGVEGGTATVIISRYEAQ